MIYVNFIKPLFDAILAGLLLFLLFIPGLFLSLVLGVYFRGSPFFTQIRTGKREMPFKIFKFRTMFDMYVQNNGILKDEERTPAFGNFLRKSGIDEIPQIINILKGEMSFVGPRPWLTEYLPLYPESVRARHTVKPGITGLAQINGGNGLDWAERFALDLKYVQDISLRLDLYILLKTLFSLNKHKNNVGNYIRK